MVGWLVGYCAGHQAVYMLIIRINTGNLRFYYAQCGEYGIASNYMQPI